MKNINDLLDQVEKDDKKLLDNGIEPIIFTKKELENCGNCKNSFIKEFGLFNEGCFCSKANMKVGSKDVIKCFEN